MLRRWRRLDYLIKHQLYLRILPVVVLAVLAVGLFSGRLLTNRAVRSYLEQRRDEDYSALVRIADRIKVEALAVEARRDHGQSAGSIKGLKDNALVSRAIRGVGFVPAWPGGPRPAGWGLSLDAECDTPESWQLLRQWQIDQRGSYLDLRWTDFMLQEAWPGGPDRIPVDNFHSIWVFAPLTLAGGNTETAAKLPGEIETTGIPVLPVVVKECDPWSNPSDESSRDTWDLHLTLLLLDIEYLTRGVIDDRVRSDDLTCLADLRGNLLRAGPEDGLSGAGGIASIVRPLAPSVAPAEVSAFVAAATEGFDHTYLGQRWRPLIVTTARHHGVPFVVVSALPFAGIHGGLVLYTAIVVLMAIIALFGSVLAITTVGEKLSGRMGAMSAHMEQVAHGDYTLQMAPGKDDEVGRLVGYFNQMTHSLGEAHSEVREKTNRLRRALETQRRLDKAKDDFLALISHEVRTPLTSIMGGVEFLQGIDRMASPEQAATLKALNLAEVSEIIAGSGQRLQDFMNDAIQMAALQSSDSRMNYAPNSFEDLCRLILSALQGPVSEKRLRIDMELPPPDEWMAYCDRELIVLALDKLLRNAVQHNVPDGRVRIREATMVPTALQSHEGRTAPPEPDPAELSDDVAARLSSVGWRVIEIFNTGPVIPQHKLDGLFKKFEIVGRIEHHQKSSGLSLPIVRAVLENHGGGVAVESFEGTGNFFYLVIPVLEMRPASGQQQGQGLSGIALYEEVDEVGDAAGAEVELEHIGAGSAGDGDESGRGVDES